MNIPAARHFLQSDEWAQFQKALKKKVIQRHGKGWQYVAILERGDGRVGRHFTRLYCPYGPHYEDAATLDLALADLEKQARSLGVDYVRVEPVCADRLQRFDGRPGYKKQQRSFQPSLTLLINLDEPFDTVLQGVSKTNRYLWKKSTRNNLTFKVSYKVKDLESFLLMMRETSERTQAALHVAQYYEILSELLGPNKVAGVAYVYHDKEVLSGVLFIDDFEAKTRYYMYAGSFDKARKFSANAPLVVFLLQQAQQTGMRVFDFFGVASKDAIDHRWAGFSKFKRSFGGEELAYGGTWEKPVRTGRYTLMSLARKLT